MNPKKRRTYYCQLLPFDAKNLIQKKEKSKSVSITLKAVPDNWGQKRYIVESFICHSKKQSASIEAEIPTFQELMMDKDKWNLEVFTVPDSMFEDSLYLYRQHKDIPYYHQAIMKVNLESVSASVDNVEIALDDKVYYNGCKHTIDRNGIKSLKFGHCLELISDKNGKSNVKFIPKGNIEGILYDAEFIKAMLTAHNFRCGGYSGELGDVKYIGIDKTIEYVNKINRLFKKLHINKEVDLTNNNVAMCDNFTVLYEGIVQNKSVRCVIRNGENLKSLNVYGAHIPVMFIRNDDGGWRVHDLFDISEGKYTIGWKVPEYEGMQTTIYTMLDKEHFIGLGKRNIESLKKCISDIEYNKLHGDRLVAMLLMMIEAYDESKDEELWKATKYVANYLLKHDNNDLNMINYYLVLSKREKLNDKIRKKLSKRLSFLENDNSGNWLAMGLCLLLKKKKEFEERLNTLTKEQQEEFKKFPIMKLYEMI